MGRESRNNEKRRVMAGPAIPMQPRNGVPLVGQPFTLTRIGIPVNAELTCNCGGADVAVTIAQSQPGQCPSCHTTYNSFYDPTKNKLNFVIQKPQAEQVQ